MDKRDGAWWWFQGKVLGVFREWMNIGWNSKIKRGVIGHGWEGRAQRAAPEGFCR